MGQETSKILVVDDDMRLRSLLERYLVEQGYQVRSAGNAEQMDRLLERENFHLMVLDLMLPGEDGLSICRRLRQMGNELPIIMLTAKGDEVDRIIGLEMGADDYLPKPFNPRELLARAKAVLRRRNSEAPGAPSKDVQVIEFGEYKLNLATREMTAGTTPLTLRDYSALERSIDVQVSRLRRMLEKDPANPRYIQTVWGLGYVFVPDGEQA